MSDPKEVEMSTAIAPHRITRMTRAQALPLSLPGRTWYTFISPDIAGSRHVSAGHSVFAPGSRPAGHVHDLEEETIICLAGRGRIVTEDSIAELEPGVMVFVPSRTFHATEADGPEPLELACVFSPPVIPGSYEHGRG